jgi:hypothetical protein
MNNNDHSTVLNLRRFTPGREFKTSMDEADSLTASIQRGAQAAADTGRRLISPAGSQLPSAQLLGVVSYCYAKGVYESAEIEDKMRHSPELRAATHDDIPGASLIRCFRRLNREAIQVTLEEAFRFLRRRAKAAACVPLPGQPPAPRSSGTFDPGSTVLFVRKEAERTLNDAAFVDNMSKD